MGGDVGQTYLTFNASGAVQQGSVISLQNPFTIEMWFQSAAQPPQDWTYGYPQQDLIINWGDGGNDRSFFLQLRNNQLVFAESADGSTNSNELIDAYGATTIPYGVWENVAVVHTASTIDLYLNGNLDGSVSTTLFPLNNRESFDVGGYFPSGDEGFTGNIDELRISNSARYSGDFTPEVTEFSPDADALDLYDFDEGSGTQTIDSATGDEATISSGVTWGAGSPVPEPTSLALLLTAVPLLALRRLCR